MRVTLAVAVACLTLVGLATAGDAKAAIRKETHIPAEGLGPALTKLAKEFDFQVLYRTEIVSDLKSPGAVGTLTSDEALGKVLTGTGLTYKYLDDKTVTIVPVSTADLGQSTSQQTPGSSNDASASKEVGKKASQDFRVAQVDQGTSSSATSVGGQTSSSTGLSEIVVTAQKRPERLQDVPISISVLSGVDLDKSSFQGASEALSTLPGVSTTTTLESGATLISMRGVSAGFTGSSSIAYYLDGVPFSLVNNSYLPDPDVYDLQRIEALRGPQGTLYGANAEAGVVRVLTNDADPSAFDFKTRSMLSTTDGGGENYGGDVMFNIPVVDGILAVRGVIDYQNLGGWINAPVGNHINDAELRTYRFKINAQPTGDLSIGLSVWSTRDGYGAPSASTTDRRSSATIAQPLTTDYDTYSFKLGYEFPYVSLTSTTSYLDYSNYETEDYGIYGVGLPHGTVLDVGLSNNLLSQEVTLHSTHLDWWHWTAGAAYLDSTDRDFANLPGILPEPIYGSEGSKSSAIFGEVGRRFLDGHFDWTVGLRYYHDDVYVANPTSRSTASFSPTTPRAVLTWYPNPEWTLYTSFSEGFRSGFPQSPNVLAVDPNFPPVQPDKLYNYEIGAKADLWGGRISLETAVYYIDWKDIQQVVSVQLTQSVAEDAGVNGQAASGPGVDFALTVRPLDRLALTASLGWNNLTINGDTYSGSALLFSKGDRLDYSPEFTGGVSGDYTFPLAGGFNGRLFASGNYTSKQTDHFLNASTVPPSVVVNTGDSQTNVRAGLAIVAPSHWSARLYGDNLTNNYGAIPAFGFASPELTPRSRPRTVGVQVDYKLK